MRRVLVKSLLLVGLMGVPPANAQQSVSFRLDEGSFVAGGHPHDGVSLSSLTFRITLHSIGQGVSPPILSSASFGLQSGPVAANAPPGEIKNVHFTGPMNLTWDPDLAAVHYAVYRGAVSVPFDAGYGLCLLPTPIGPSMTDTTMPQAGETLFYLVTALNRLQEESIKGNASDGTLRVNSSPCP